MKKTKQNWLLCAMSILTLMFKISASSVLQAVKGHICILLVSYSFILEAYHESCYVTSCSVTDNKNLKILKNLLMIFNDCL